MIVPWQISSGAWGSSRDGRAEIAAEAKATPSKRAEMRQEWRDSHPNYVDRFSLPAIVQTIFFFTYGDKEVDAMLAPPVEHDASLRAFPPNRAELAFMRFLALDSAAAAALSLSLLRWRRESGSARRLAAALGLFSLALALFLVNGQAALRGGLFAWPSGSRLLSDVTCTLALGLSILGIERFFSTFPVPIEDWEVIQSQLRWRGKALVDAPRRRPWYLGGGANLVTLARAVTMVIIGLFLASTLASSVPDLLHSPSFLLRLAPDATPKGFSEDIHSKSVMAGAILGMVGMLMVGAFGWLVAASLLAKLRAGRRHCTEEERRQADWLFAGGFVTALMLAVFSLGLLLLLLFVAWGNGDWLRSYALSTMMMFFPAGWAIMLLALAGAVFLSRSFGPKPLLKRTLLITGIGLTMSFVLAIIEHTVTSTILGHSAEALRQGVSAILAGGIVVFPVGLFRTRIEHGIDGLLDRYMPATAIAEGKRRDMAVMFSDLGGFSALSATDEQEALVLAGLFQKEATEAARRHGGRIVKTIGDAVLWVFATPAEAFAASMDLSACFAREVRRDKLPELSVNSGVHYGSLVEAHNGDVYGAAVNLAGHITGAARDGSVVASVEAVVEAAEGFQFEAMGKLELKNIPTPIPCFRVTAP